MGTHDHAMHQNCLRCGDDLPDGVKFCVACGTLNMDADGGKLGAANIEMKSKQRIAKWQTVVYWWRYLYGIRW